MNEREPSTPNPERLNRTADRFGQWILEGITAAHEGHREIDDMTARLIAHVLGRALGRESALADFGRTGEGSYEALRDEYLTLYGDPSTPPMISEWIDWLGTHLVQRENAGSGRQFMNEHLPPKLAQLLVRTRVAVGGQQFTVHLPASYGEAGIIELTETLKELSLDEDPALQAFLSLPDVNAMSGDIMQDFHDNYIGTYMSIEDAIHEVAEVDEIERDVRDYAEERHLFIEGVTPDYEALRETAENGYDFVEREGRVYVFNK